MSKEGLSSEGVTNEDKPKRKGRVRKTPPEHFVGIIFEGRILGNTFRPNDEAELEKALLYARKYTGKTGMSRLKCYVAEIKELGRPF